MRTYHDYHYHSLAKLVFMCLISFGVYGIYYWYRLMRGKYNHATMGDRVKSLGLTIVLFFAIYELLKEVSSRLGTTKPNLVLQGPRSPAALTAFFIVGSIVLFVIQVLMMSVFIIPNSGQGVSGHYLITGLTWVLSMAVVLWPIIAVQTHINQAYLLENKVKPHMSMRGYFWHGLFLIFAILQLMIIMTAPTESDLQNVDIDYSGKLPKELLSF